MSRRAAESMTCTLPHPRARGKRPRNGLLRRPRVETFAYIGALARNAPRGSAREDGLAADRADDRGTPMFASRIMTAGALALAVAGGAAAQNTFGARWLARQQA